MLSNTLIGKDLYSLNELNIRYRNIVYEYFMWFDQFIIRDKRGNFMQNVLDLALSIDQHTITDISNFGQVVTTLIANVQGSSIPKSLILEKVNSLMSVVALCKGENPVKPES